MRRKTFIFSLVYILIFLSAFSIKSFYTAKDKSPIVLKKGSLYTKEWQEVDSLEKKYLPKSALELTKKIYSKAKMEDNIPQIVKALLHEAKFSNMIEEDGLLKTIERLEEEIAISKTPLKQILHSVNASLYLNYFQNNKWLFYGRTQTEDKLSDDIKTWDAKQISEKIIQQFDLSMSSVDSLQRIEIGSIESIILSDKKNYQRTWPTIYDFVAYRASEVYANELVNISKLKDEFKVDEALFFEPYNRFIDFEIKTQDSSSLKYKQTKIIQELLRFHEQVENPDALIDADLYRLKTFYKLSESKKKDELYLKALERLLQQFENLPYANYIRYQIAEISQKLALGLVNEPEKNKMFTKFNSQALENINFIKNSKTKDSILIQKCEYLYQQIHRSNLSLQTENTVLPNEAFPINIGVRNINHINLKVLKVDNTTKQKLDDLRIYGKAFYARLLKSAELLSEQKQDVSSMQDFQQHATELIMPALKKGLYLLAVEGFSSEGDTMSIDYTYLRVSNLAVLQNSNENKMEVQVLNRKTGDPIAEASVKVWYSDYSYSARKSVKRKAGRYTTDAQGWLNVDLSTNKNIVIEVETEDDFFSSEDQMYLHESYKQPARAHTYFFTDRKIYRPGQSVFFKAILIEQIGDERKIQKNKDVEVILYDVNYQKVTSLNLKTNDFGSVNGKFEIPKGVLTGQMHLQTKDGSVYFQVEEYKRPQFEVTFDKFEGHYKFNETVEVKGKATGFAGNSISNSKFVYRVVRMANYAPYWRYVREPDIEISNGTGFTDDKGAFTFSFDAKADLEIEHLPESYTYTLSIDVTDIGGETRSASESINVGKKALRISAQLPQVLMNQSIDSVQISTVNLNGEAIGTQVQYEIVKLESTNTLKNNTYWTQPDVHLVSKTDWEKQLPNYKYIQEDLQAKEMKSLFKGQVDTKKSAYFNLKQMQLAEGLYRIHLKGKDPFGEMVEKSQDFTILNSSSSKMPYIQKQWFKVLKGTVEPGNNAKILIGSSFKDLKVLVEIDKKGKTKERYFMTLSNEKKLITIPVLEADRGGFYVNVSFVHENRVYQNNTRIDVPHSDKQLDIQFETFRNKLYPGQKETWKIKIKGHKGEKVASEFLAAMYDASLDEFASQSWAFSILDYYYGKSAMNAQGFASAYARNLYQTNVYQANPNFSTPELNWFGFEMNGRYGNRIAYKSTRFALAEDQFEMAGEVEMEDATIPVLSETVVVDGLVDQDKIATKKGKVDKRNLELENSVASNTKDSIIKLKVRKNFDETAFFLPELQTDENGDVIFKFTMPESLSKWNFKGFAHTQDLKFGFINESIVTQKDLMVFPNPPRFFREGDKMVFPVKVSNLTNKKMKVNANIRFYNAMDGQEITNIIYPDFTNHTFEIAAKGSFAFVASLSIPEGYAAISYKVIASSSKFADGEENVIPVLSNRMLVTESLPLSIRKKGTKTFKFDKLIHQKSTTLKHYNYTLEMTSNPAWYAVQALPYLVEYPYECAEQTFSRYYANALASHIANSNPKIKAVFEQWKNTPKQEGLMSNLEKNQELKALLIQESPWLLDAKNESEQKQRIAELFDMHQLAASQAASLNQLRQMQGNSGAWPWFKGMRENRYITQLIVSGFGHLRKLGVVDLSKDASTQQTLRKAIAYLDKEITQDYKELKINFDDKQLHTSSHTSQSQIQYLYARSFFIDLYPVPSSSLKAYEYFSKNAKDFWTKESKYMQAMIGLIATREQRDKTGIHVEHEIVKSLKEHALHSEEMGMYWKNTSSYYWHQAPIEQQAIMIELFSEIRNEEASVEELKVWLLKQKQTQNWKTTRATADAIYALLMNGTDLLTEDPGVQIRVAGEKLKMDPSNTEVGTAYYKTTWPVEKIKPEMGEIELSKKTDGLAWGAVYWQYFEDLDKITKHETPLKLEKQIFISENSAKGPVLKSIQKHTINVGDKLVVRITLRVDRDLEYVHMKDMRASGFEPINVISSYKWKNGLGYYESTKDASTNFFFDYLRKGTYVFEYPLRAVHQGDFSNGITTIQCMYAPEFTSHSEGLKVVVGE